MKKPPKSRDKCVGVVESNRPMWMLPATELVGAPESPYDSPHWKKKSGKSPEAEETEALVQEYRIGAPLKLTRLR